MVDKTSTSADGVRGGVIASKDNLVTCALSDFAAADNNGNGDGDGDGVVDIELDCASAAEMTS